MVVSFRPVVQAHPFLSVPKIIEILLIKKPDSEWSCALYSVEQMQLWQAARKTLCEHLYVYFYINEEGFFLLFASTLLFHACKGMAQSLSFWFYCFRYSKMMDGGRSKSKVCPWGCINNGTEWGAIAPLSLWALISTQPLRFLHNEVDTGLCCDVSILTDVLSCLPIAVPPGWCLELKTHCL